MILSQIFLFPYILPLALLLYYLLPYLRARALIKIPGPRVAAFSNLWLLCQCRLGRRYLAVDAAHRKYGKVVRIQPNHVSIADPDAISVIYSHTGGWLKRYVLNRFLLMSTLFSFIPAQSRYQGGHRD